MAGQFGAWTLIGAEQTASGYEVAWKLTGADQYTVWNTDSSGNFISNYRRCVGNQHCVGIARDQFPPGPERRRGDRCSSHDGDRGVWIDQPDRGWEQFFLDSSSGSGPELKYAGANVVAGQFGAWTPIGAEQTASGYEVAWKITGADQYTVWNTDSSGNYISNIIGVVSGTSTALESLETSFHQDLNGDGVIGLFPRR